MWNCRNKQRQRQLKWGCELIEEQRHALRGAAAPYDLLSNIAARYVSEQSRALWDSLPCSYLSNRHQSYALPAEPLKYRSLRAEARLQPPASALRSHAETWPGRTRSPFLIPVGRHAAVPPRSPRKGRQFRRLQSSKGQRSLIFHPRRPSLR